MDAGTGSRDQRAAACQTGGSACPGGFPNGTTDPHGETEHRALPEHVAEHQKHGRLRPVATVRGIPPPRQPVPGHRNTPGRSVGHAPDVQGHVP